jgi:LysM repeat protein
MMKTPTLTGNQPFASIAASSGARPPHRASDVAVAAGAAATPRTAAGERALHRRRARLSADRRPPSGVLPSTGRTAAVVRADRGDAVRDVQFAMGRVTRLLCTVVLISATVLIGAALVRPTGTEVVREVTVEQGDTLWSIAQRVAPDADPRVEAEQIRRLNDLDADPLTVGIVLKVPTRN